MHWRSVGLSILALVLCLSIPAQAAGAEVDISGTYRCVGTNPDGTQYRGVVEIVKNEGTYRVTWMVGRHMTSIGIGLVRDGNFTVSYVADGNLGIIVYRIQKGPQLVGEWTMLGADPDLFPETLTKLGVSAYNGTEPGRRSLPGPLVPYADQR